MVIKTPKPVLSSDILLPERYPEDDLFICDVSDAVLKDIIPHLEHPFYTLSKQPVRDIRRYERGGRWVEIRPSIKGLPSIYDKDILIYAISQLIAKLNAGEKVSKRVRLDSFDFLRFTNRGTGGRDYDALVDALDRLDGTRIATNIQTGDEEQRETFGLIESTTIRRKNGLTGRILWIELTLSNWVFNAIASHEVLTLSRDYFRLRKPIERRIYELARKHCGSQREWRCSMAVLYEKSGSASPIKNFRYMVRQVVESDHLPDYTLSIDEDVVVFKNRGTVTAAVLESVSIPPLDPEVYEAARAAAPGWDVRYIESEWRSWATEAPKNPEMAFLGFCRKWYESRGAP